VDRATAVAACTISRKAHACQTDRRGARPPRPWLPRTARNRRRYRRRGTRWEFSSTAPGQDAGGKRAAAIRARPVRGLVHGRRCRKANSQRNEAVEEKASAETVCASSHGPKAERAGGRRPIRRGHEGRKVHRRRGIATAASAKMGGSVFVPRLHQRPCHARRAGRDRCFSCCRRRRQALAGAATRSAKKHALQQALVSISVRDNTPVGRSLICREESSGLIQKKSGRGVVKVLKEVLLCLGMARLSSTHTDRTLALCAGSR